jgi:PAS domain S-box-containing protein
MAAGTPDPGRFLIRRALPIVIAVTVATGWLCWFASDRGLIDKAVGVALMTALAVLLFTGLSVWSARKLRATAGRRHAERDALYRTLARNYQGGAVYLFDRELRYLLAEGQSLDQVGLEPAALEGRTIWEALDPDTAAQIEPVYRAALAGETSSFEMSFRGQAYRVTVAPTVDDAGKIIGGLVQTLQITEQKGLEEQLLQSQKLEAVGQLAGGVAHDFNNLLTVISGYASLTLPRLEADDPARHPLEEIAIAADRASALTRQLLAFSRKQMLQPRLIEVGEVVEGLTPMLRRLIEANIELAVRLTPDLPPVLFDRGQLEQVLVNLVVNARDAMSDGGTITIETDETALDEAYAQAHADAQVGPHVVVAVSDTGRGLDEATRTHMFEPFFTTKAVGEGTGLGLSTVHGIVKQSGGNIWVYSELRRGTTFKIYIPVAGETETAEAAPAAPAAPSAAPPASATVLVVDDHDILRGLAAEVLEEAGYDVLQAASSDDAASLLEQHAVDLVLADVVMPGGSGHELAEARDARGTSPPIIYMSGYTEETVSRQALLSGDVRFLEKPFTPAALLVAAREALGR